MSLSIVSSVDIFAFLKSFVIPGNVDTIFRNPNTPSSIPFSDPIKESSCSNVDAIWSFEGFSKSATYISVPFAIASMAFLKASDNSGISALVLALK
jgi:hypothetical protein